MPAYLRCSSTLMASSMPVAKRIVIVLHAAATVVVKALQYPTQAVWAWALIKPLLAYDSHVLVLKAGLAWSKVRCARAVA